MDEAGLPSPGTSFVGRAAECAAVCAVLDWARLVTLVGPAGVGKTRLAVAVAAQPGPALPSDVVFADLVGVRPDFLAQAVAAACGVAERPGQPLEQALQERLGQGRCLLVMDHCERLLDAAAGLVGRLLVGCPALAVLATSAERLGVPGEHVLPVSPLTLPGEAEALFRDRARAAGAVGDTDRELVGELCARLAGIPLAIELAAAQTGSLGLAGLRTGLDSRLCRPVGEHDGEHDGEGCRHVLRAVFDWSYQLLDDHERRLLRRLAVFVRGFDLDAVVQVGADGDPDVAADLVGRLAATGLLVPERETPTSRWRMPDPVRDEAADRLVAEGEQPQCADRYLEWALALAAELEHRVQTDQPWRAYFDLVADDLRAALDAAARSRPAAHRLVRALGHLCYARQFLREAGQHFERAAGYAGDDATAAADLRAAADVSLAEHCGEPAFWLLQESAQRAGTAGDAQGQAIALASAACLGGRFPATFTEEVPHRRLHRLLDQAKRVAPADDPLVAAYLAAAEAWNATGVKTTSDPELAHQALEAARTAEDPMLISAGIDAVTSAYGTTGQFRAAHLLSHERIALFDRLPRHDPQIGLEIVDTLHVVPLVAVAAGELADAVTAAQRAWDDPFSGLYMRASKFVVPLMLYGRFDEALHFAAVMWDGWQRAGRPAARWMAPAVHAVALVHSLRGQDDDHHEWLDRARRMAAPHGQGHVSDSFAAFADPRMALHATAIDEALAAAVDLSETPSWPEVVHQFFDAYSWAVAAEIAVVAGLPDARDRLAVAAAAGAQSAWAAACLARAHGRLHGDQDALRESLAGWDRIGARFERACTLLLLPDRAAEGLAELTSLGCEPPAKREHPLGSGFEAS